jgi:hypothetical protein
MILKRKGLRKAFLGALQAQGPQAARAVLDRRIPATKKLKLNQIVDQRERMAALAILNDVTSLQAELDGHHGPLTGVTQVNAMGLLGVALRSAEPGPAATALEQVADNVDQHGGRSLGLVKKKTRALAKLARALDGGQLESRDRLTLESFSRDGGMVELVVLAATARALDAAGQPKQAAGLRGKVEAHTSALTTPRDAAA